MKKNIILNGLILGLTLTVFPPMAMSDSSGPPPGPVVDNPGAAAAAAKPAAPALPAVPIHFVYWDSSQVKHDSSNSIDKQYLLGRLAAESDPSMAISSIYTLESSPDFQTAKMNLKNSLNGCSRNQMAATSNMDTSAKVNFIENVGGGPSFSFKIEFPVMQGNQSQAVGFPQAANEVAVSSGEIEDSGGALNQAVLGEMQRITQMNVSVCGAEQQQNSVSQQLDKMIGELSTPALPWSSEDGDSSSSLSGGQAL